MNKRWLPPCVSHAHASSFAFSSARVAVLARPRAFPPRRATGGGGSEPGSSPTLIGWSVMTLRHMTHRYWLPRVGLVSRTFSSCACAFPRSWKVRQAALIG